MTCTQRDHDALKADPLLFEAATVPAYVQDGVAYRNCLRCRSTLSLPPPCALCEKPCPRNDALPLGDGYVHAACAFDLTKRLPAAKVSMLVRRHINKESR